MVDDTSTPIHNTLAVILAQVQGNRAENKNNITAQPAEGIGVEQGLLETGQHAIRAEISHLRAEVVALRGGQEAIERAVH